MPVPEHRVRIPATTNVSQQQQQSKAEERIFLSPLRFNNCSQFTQQLFKFHLSRCKEKKKKQQESNKLGARRRLAFPMSLPIRI